MRISDWSSDVCSSDLLLALQQRHKSRNDRTEARCIEDVRKDRSCELPNMLDLSNIEQSLHIERLLFHSQSAADDEDRAEERNGCNCCGATDDGFEDAHRPRDRKSVVEGKSVYESVDIGGRGIINSKNKQRTPTESNNK